MDKKVPIFHKLADWLDWPCPVGAALHFRPQKMTGNGCISFYQLSMNQNYHQKLCLVFCHSDPDPCSVLLSTYQVQIDVTPQLTKIGKVFVITNANYATTVVHGPVRCVNYNVGTNVEFQVNLRICQRSENLKRKFWSLIFQKKQRKYFLTSEKVVHSKNEGMYFILLNSP